MNRLTLLSTLLKDYKMVADIGCDHAFVSIESVLKYNVKKVYACDINQGPLDNAIKNIKKYNLEDQIIPVLSDGLLGLKKDVDAILISGMGGALISKILSDSISKAKRASKLILQANSEVEDLRKFLLDNNFHILDEHSLYDKNKYYEIIECSFKDESYTLSELELMFGPFLLKKKNEAFMTHYGTLRNHFLKQLEKINEENTKKMLKSKIDFIEEAIGTSQT